MPKSDPIPLPSPHTASAGAAPPAAAPDPATAGADVPEKFRDPETGAVNVPALLASYRELERKLARMVELPGDDADPNKLAQFRRAVGVPETPDDYAIEAPDDLIQPDPEINARLHAAGFTPGQVQLVYEIAAEHMLPALAEVSESFEAERQTERLVDHFGGEDKWREISGQLAAWGRKNLPEEVFEALSGTFEGVLAMHRMMANGEPGLGAGSTPEPAGGEAELRRIMADPKYWRERDPATVKQVQDGFRRLFPEAAGG
jgi:hypothetical protein